MEGRWLRAPDDRAVDDYAFFWFRGGGWRRQYTFWPAHALWERALVSSTDLAAGAHVELLGELAEHYEAVRAAHFSRRGGCLVQSCHADGQENSAGLDGCRPTINSVTIRSPSLGQARDRQKPTSPGVP